MSAAFWQGIENLCTFRFQEVFPKQDHLSGKGFGNLIRLPAWNQSHFTCLGTPITRRELIRHTNLLPTQSPNPKPLRSSTICQPLNLGTTDSSDEEIEEAQILTRRLPAWICDDYDLWINVGMALCSVSADLFSSWKEWSVLSSKYRAGDCERRWDGFGFNCHGIQTLRWMAREFGEKQELQLFGDN